MYNTRYTMHNIHYTMHHKVGSTVRGIADLLNTKDVFVDYYNDVYPSIDMARLQQYCASTRNTGYDFSSSMSAAHSALYKVYHTL